LQHILNPSEKQCRQVLLEWAMLDSAVKEILSFACDQLMKPPRDRDLDRQDAVVPSQLCNTRLRALETERRTIEHDELLERLEGLEEVAAKVKSGVTWTR
jgi:hypothetical protein